MTDTKLDFGSTTRPATPARVIYDVNAKLDLPGTLEEFVALGDAPRAALEVPSGLRDKMAEERAADAAGVALIPFGVPPIGWAWLIERIVVIGGGQVRVYVGGLQVNNVVDLSATGSADVADEASPIFVRSGEPVAVEFSGAAVGLICAANMQVRYVSL